METGKQLVLDKTLIDTLKVADLNRQLDWHRDNEKNFPDLEAKVPLKTHMSIKADRVDELKKAVDRYQGLMESIVGTSSEVPNGVNMEGTLNDEILYASDYEDNMI
ncbi:hypothetical protein LshimejAT787_0101020 [Lyophyllum shimeji]|uniref:Uncharacterized protein n=1 Tax=Lyophyllum shimeji TaxID=47721 RepID=A0A9P3PCG8_LYOSH|nr:hypothetical protein LshimejAT787_0101020 [Lyophyllum shimeji]